MPIPLRPLIGRAFRARNAFACGDTGERTVEIVADRGISRQVPDAHWQAVVKKLGEYLQAGDFDSGLTQALQEVSALLVQHFPVQPDAANPNELCNRVVWA